MGPGYRNGTRLSPWDKAITMGPGNHHGTRIPEQSQSSNRYNNHWQHEHWTASRYGEKDENVRNYVDCDDDSL